MLAPHSELWAGNSNPGFQPATIEATLNSYGVMITTLLQNLTKHSALLLLVLAAAALTLSAQDKPSGKVNVMAFNDTNLNGVLDGSETPASGEKAQLYRVDDDGTRTLISTCTTDETGQCGFDNLPYGRYVVVYTLSTGVAIETLPFTLSADKPEMSIRPAPVLPKNRTLIGGISLLDLGFRNPANTIGDQVSRFSP